MADLKERNSRLIKTVKDMQKEIDRLNETDKAN